MSLAEYNRRWDMLMEAYRTGLLSKDEASQAVRELTAVPPQHNRREPYGNCN
jgi:predicted RNA-binding protein associated with RNAse of E/G family